jgi:lysophospholipase L1-like esterase
MIFAALIPACARPSRIATLPVVALAALIAAGAVRADADAPASPPAAGPTPYPADARDWPGSGVIRVFGWMNDNRRSFWLERDRKQGAVVFAGDSLVGGWRTLADDLPQIPVANRGIGGEPTRGLLFRFQEDVLDLHPRAIVLLTGTNDLSARQDIRKARSNITAMLDMADRAAPGVPIVLCTLPPRQDPKSPIDPRQLIGLNQLIVASAQGRTHVAVLDLYTLLADPDGSPHAEYFAADKLHLSPAGQKRWRDALAPLLKRFDIG